MVLVRSVAALIIILACVLLLNAFGILSVSFRWVLAVFWPVPLIIWGLQGLIRFIRGRRLGRPRQLVYALSPILTTAFGVLLVISNLGWIGAGTISFWRIGSALLLLHLGMRLLSFPSKDEHVISSFLGDLHYGDSPFALESTRYEITVGGLRLDLSQALMPEEEVVLDFAIGMGDVEILVPAHLPIAVDILLGLGDIQVFSAETGGVNRAFSWESPEYTAATRRVRMFFEIGIGGVVIRYV